MTQVWILDILCLAGILVSAALVIICANPLPAVMALSAMGTILGTLFVVLAAPDVALAEVVVGAIATPMLYLIALGKIRTDVTDPGEDRDRTGKASRHG